MIGKGEYSRWTKSFTGEDHGDGARLRSFQNKESPWGREGRPCWRKYYRRVRDYLKACLRVERPGQAQERKDLYPEAAFLNHRLKISVQEIT